MDIKIIIWDIMTYTGEWIYLFQFPNFSKDGLRLMQLLTKTLTSAHGIYWPWWPCKAVQGCAMFQTCWAIWCENRINESRKISYFHIFSTRPPWKPDLDHTGPREPRAPGSIQGPSAPVSPHIFLQVTWLDLALPSDRGTNQSLFPCPTRMPGSLAHPRLDLCSLPVERHESQGCLKEIL